MSRLVVQVCLSAILRYCREFLNNTPPSCGYIHSCICCWSECSFLSLNVLTAVHKSFVFHCSCAAALLFLLFQIRLEHFRHTYIYSNGLDGSKMEDGRWSTDQRLHFANQRLNSDILHNCSTLGLELALFKELNNVEHIFYAPMQWSIIFWLFLNGPFKGIKYSRCTGYKIEVMEIGDAKEPTASFALDERAFPRLSSGSCGFWIIFLSLYYHLGSVLHL